MNHMQGNSVPTNAPDPNQNPPNASHPNQMHRNARREVNPPAVNPAPFAIPYPPNFNYNPHRSSRSTYVPGPRSALYEPGLYLGMVNSVAAVYPNNNHNPPYNPNPNRSFICPCCSNVHRNHVSPNSDNSIPLNPRNFHNPNDALDPDPGLIYPLYDDDSIIPNYPTANHIPGRSINANSNGNHIPPGGSISSNLSANNIPPGRSVNDNSNSNHIPGSTINPNLHANNIPSFRSINSNLIAIDIPPGTGIIYQASLYQPSPVNRVVSAPNPIYSPARDYNSDQYPHRPCVPRSMQPVSAESADDESDIPQYMVRPPTDLDLIATARAVRCPPSPRDDEFAMPRSSAWESEAADDELPVPNVRFSAWESDSPGSRNNYRHHHGPYNAAPAQNSVHMDQDNPRTTASNAASSMAPSCVRRVRIPYLNSTLCRTSTASDLRNIDLTHSDASRSNAIERTTNMNVPTTSTNASVSLETSPGNNNSSVPHSVPNSLTYTNYDNPFAILRKHFEQDQTRSRAMENSRWDTWNLRRENNVTSPSTSMEFEGSTPSCPLSSRSSPANHSTTVDPGHSGDHAVRNVNVSPIQVNVEESQENACSNADQNRNTNSQLDTQPQEQNAASNVSSNNCSKLKTETREMSTNYRQLLISFLNRLDDVNIEMNNAYPNLDDDLINMFVSSLSAENLRKLLEHSSNAIGAESVAQNLRKENQGEGSDMNDSAENSRNENQENSNSETNAAVSVAETTQEPVQCNSNLDSCSDNTNMEQVAVQNPDGQIKLPSADDNDVINMNLDTIEVTVGDTSVEDSTAEILLTLSNEQYLNGIEESSEFLSNSQIHFSVQQANGTVSNSSNNSTVNITKAHSNMPNRNIRASSDTFGEVPLNLSLKDTGNCYSEKKDTTSEAAQRQDVQVTPQTIHSQTGMKMKQDDNAESRAIAQLFDELSKSINIEPPIKKLCKDKSKSKK